MIPICIQTIENDDDRDFMEWLFLEYHLLMYATISLWRAGIMPSRRKSVSAEPPSLWGMG